MSEGLTKHPERLRQVFPEFDKESIETPEKGSASHFVAKENSDQLQAELVKRDLEQGEIPEGEQSLEGSADTDTNHILMKLHPTLEKSGIAAALQELMREEADIVAGYPHGTVEAINTLRHEAKDE